MKIGVISDTHLTGCDYRLKNILDNYFNDVDMILHAGDLVDISVLDVFAGIDVKAVCGNMDPPSVRRCLPDRLIISLRKFRLGLIHGWGMPFGIENKLIKEIGSVDCLVYGHTHRPANEVKGGVLFFNPGSAIDKRFSYKNTVGILNVGDNISGEILEIDNY